MGECRHGPTCPQITGSSHKTRPSRLPHGAGTASRERADAKEMTAKIRGRSQKPKFKSITSKFFLKPKLKLVVEGTNKFYNEIQNFKSNITKSELK